MAFPLGITFFIYPLILAFGSCLNSELFVAFLILENAHPKHNFTKLITTLYRESLCL